MKIIIMNGRKDTWYSTKIGKVYKVYSVKETIYMTQEGPVKKKDAEVIEL